jgi:hypothetical protein
VIYNGHLAERKEDPLDETGCGGVGGGRGWVGGVGMKDGEGVVDGEELAEDPEGVEHEEGGVPGYVAWT